ncbi:MAG: glycosyltransferase family 4 protein [Planctomycetes bacterium]|nr:glycosyltransferase family 4 protein [Planctomycetota bacterium]
MKKILFIITLSEWGGAQKICFDLATNLDKRKFTAEVAANPVGLLSERLVEHGIVFHPIKRLRRNPSLVNDFLALIFLYRLIKAGEYDIVHCHTTKAGILGRIAAKLNRTKKIYFTAHGWGFYNKEYKWAKSLLFFLERTAARWSTKIVCVSKKTRIDAIEKTVAKSDKFLVINNGISWHAQTTRNEIREKLSIKKEEVIIGFVGRLAYPKEPLAFLKAALAIHRKFRRAKFFLIGSGPLKIVCENFIIEHRLENNCLLFGEQNPEETRSLMLCFDMIVSTSLYEGSPIIMLEAMCASLPIIATSVGGVTELVVHGHNGLLVPPNDTRRLVNEITRLIVDEEQRKKMGIKNNYSIHENFSINTMVQNYARLYESE